MRRLTFIPLASLLTLSLSCSGESVKAITSKTVSKAVEAGKGVVAGIDDGIDAGRKVGDSPDGARIVTSHKDLGEKVLLEIGEAHLSKEQVLVVQVAVTNQEGQAVRLTNLKALGLDKQGFAYPAESVAELTVPADAKGELLLRFEGKGLKTHKVRVWGTELKGEVNPVKDKKASTKG